MDSNDTTSVLTDSAEFIGEGNVRQYIHIQRQMNWYLFITVSLESGFKVFHLIFLVFYYFIPYLITHLQLYDLIISSYYWCYMHIQPMMQFVNKTCCQLRGTIILTQDQLVYCKMSFEQSKLLSFSEDTVHLYLDLHYIPSTQIL